MAIVYQHRRLDTLDVFYVGIGKDKRRAYSKKARNPHWHNVVEKLGYIVEILYKGVSWEAACEIEKKYIKHYGRKDLGLGPLVNMTDGGEGTINVSDETRKKLSESQKGKKVNEETRKKIGEKNKLKNKGKQHSQETRKKMSEKHKGKQFSEETRKKLSDSQKGKKNFMFGKKPVNTKKVAQLDKDTNIIIKIWDSTPDASKELKIERRNICYVCNGKGKTAGGFKWKYYEG